MKKKLFSLICLCSMASVDMARSELVEQRRYGDWMYQYHYNVEESTISFCAIEREYSDAIFTIRIYGENMDFFFFRRDFSLPVGKSLGSVIFEFGNRSFLLAATATNGDNTYTNSMFLQPDTSEISELYDAIRSSRELGIVFPNNTTNTLRLNGTAAAMDRASRCWRENHTGAPRSTNPFERDEPSSPAKVNPFDA